MPGSSFPAQRSYAHKSVDATLGENGQPLVVSRRLILPRREEGRWSAVKRHCLCIHPELLAVLPPGISILSSRSHHLTREATQRTLQYCFYAFCTPLLVWSFFLLNTGSVLTGSSGRMCLPGGQQVMQEQSTGQRAWERAPSLSLCLHSWWGWEPMGRPSPRRRVFQP